MKVFGKHSVLVAQANSLWYKRGTCVSPKYLLTHRVRQKNAGGISTAQNTGVPPQFAVRNLHLLMLYATSHLLVLRLSLFRLSAPFAAHATTEAPVVEVFYLRILCFGHRYL